MWLGIYVLFVGRLTEAVKLITKTEATHIFVFMLSSETRNRKPYALPVQCLPIASLKDAQVRDLVNKIVSVMKQKEMKCVGTIIMLFNTSGIMAYRLIFKYRIHHRW